MLSTTTATRLALGLMAVAFTASLSAQQMLSTPNRRTAKAKARSTAWSFAASPSSTAPAPRRAGPWTSWCSRVSSRKCRAWVFPSAIVADRRPAKGTRDFDGTGLFLMPGFVDAHVHCGGGQANNPEYVYKLWLAHGVTTVRGVPCGSMDWDLAQRELSAKNQIVAPRQLLVSPPFSGEGWDRARRRRPSRAVSGCGSPPRRASTA